ncbi:hypothetical protein Q0601_05220 [Paracoccus onubensis]|uniref:hypothetical protein n=1 Tax=Paracoccus onubensis TaxID=1675788 RepID=UPI00272F9B86|nr:hypothetical protein [Paracoccus onubensis]MDP0926560.1 hypothetical protein [Paracoccus onubensis]
MLTMRFLLTFYSEAAGQLRCLDSAHLPAFRSGRVEDIPAALQQEPDLVMRWMLGRYEIADVLIPEPRGPEGAAKQGDLIAVYALDPECAVIGLGNDYHGAWLEMFLHGNQPLGSIATRKARISPTTGAIASLEDRVTHPLNTRDEACRRTADKITGYRSMLDESRKDDVRWAGHPEENV